MKKQPRILIIDDDPDITLAMRIVLESKGYKVLSASNSQEGFKLIKSEPPDLIILDVMMTTRDEGFQLAYKLKNESLFAKIPILISTAVGKETGFKFSQETDEDWLPVDDFVEKPLHPEELLNRVEKLLQRRV